MKENNARYYQKNKEAQLARNRANRKRNFDFVAAIKEASACADCEKSYPHYVMEFDHVGDDKEAAISDMCNRLRPVAAILAEIEKCELVCANCHRERTFRRKREMTASSSVA